MPRTVTERLASVHPQMLRVESESTSKKLADAKRAIGHSVARALEIAGITKQQAAYDMGYQDAGTVSRWCSGLERPHFDKLFTLPRVEDAWILARAECNPHIVVETVVKIPRVA